MKKVFVFIGLLVMMPSLVFAYTSPGKPTGYVNDFAGVMSAQAKTELEQELSDFDKSTQHEIAIVTVKSLGGDDIESYSKTLFREWGVGKKELNNGVMFVAAIDDHKMRIEVGYGLEGALTDIQSQDILDNMVGPSFKKGDFDSGLKGAATGIEQAIKGEVVGGGSSASQPVNISLKNYFEAGFWVLFFILPWLASILGRSKSWWAGGLIGGVIGVVVFLFGAAIWWTAGLVIFGLLFDYLVSKNYKAGKNSWWAGGGPWIGGFGGGGDSSGGGFGGFGGGSSGGGGASSSW